MNQYLVDLSIEYHGSMLVDQLEAEQVDVTLPNFLSMVNKNKSMDSPKDEAFQKQISSLIARKSDLLFATKRCAAASLAGEVTGYDAVIPPIETFLDIPAMDRKKHFFSCVEKSDIVIGLVTEVQDAGMMINLLCMDQGKARDIDQLKISVFCPVREMSMSFPHEDPLEYFNMKDKVRGVVLSVCAEKEHIVVSLQKRALPAHLEHLKLGLISDVDLPPHFRQLQEIDKATYHQHLLKTLDFNNPTNVATLSSKLKTCNNQSFTRKLHSMRNPKEESAEALHKKQSYRLALKSVSEGISHFKEGRHMEAMQYLNKALQIDKDNVEALVARGALYASNESYFKAIEDFEAALLLNPNHTNAKRYICETLVELGRRLNDEKEMPQEAKEGLEKAMQICPAISEVQDLLKEIQGRSSGQGTSQAPDTNVVSSKDQSHGEYDEKQTSHQLHVFTKTKETLRKIIEEERAKKSSRREEKMTDEDRIVLSSTSCLSSDSTESESSSSTPSLESPSLSSISRSRSKSQTDNISANFNYHNLNRSELQATRVPCVKVKSPKKPSDGRSRKTSNSHRNNGEDSFSTKCAKSSMQSRKRDSSVSSIGLEKENPRRRSQYDEILDVRDSSKWYAKRNKSVEDKSTERKKSTSPREKIELGSKLAMSYLPERTKPDVYETMKIASVSGKSRHSRSPTAKNCVKITVFREDNSEKKSIQRQFVQDEFSLQSSKDYNDSRQDRGKSASIHTSRSGLKQLKYHDPDRHSVGSISHRSSPPLAQSSRHRDVHETYKSADASFSDQDEYFEPVSKRSKSKKSSHSDTLPKGGSSKKCSFSSYSEKTSSVEKVRTKKKEIFSKITPKPVHRTSETHRTSSSVSRSRHLRESSSKTSSNLNKSSNHQSNSKSKHLHKSVSSSLSSSSPYSSSSSPDGSRRQRHSSNHGSSKSSLSHNFDKHERVKDRDVKDDKNTNSSDRRSQPSNIQNDEAGKSTCLDEMEQFLLKLKQKKKEQTAAKK